MIHPASLDLGHPLAYLTVFVLSLVDGVVPLVPTRTVVIALGVLAGDGDVRAYPLLALAAAAAYLSDNAAYWLGAHRGPQIAARVFRGRRGRRAWEWAGRQFGSPRGTLLVALSRLIPGGPTPFTLAAGATGFPRHRFRVLAAVSSGLWAVYAFGFGLAGTAAVAGNPLLALLFAVLLAAVVNTALVLTVRRRAGAAPRRHPPR